MKKIIFKEVEQEMSRVKAPSWARLLVSVARIVNMGINREIADIKQELNEMKESLNN